MRYIDGINLINKAIEESEKRKLWEMWLTIYPHMNKETYISFEQFYDKVTTPISQKSSNEIYDESMDIYIKHLERRKSINGTV